MTGPPSAQSTSPSMWLHERILICHSRPLNLRTVCCAIMKLKFIIAASITVLPWLSGCAITTTPLTSIGPGRVNSAGRGPDGYLEVYTATRTVDANFHNYFDLHDGYDINDASGKAVKYVDNHDSEIDEGVDRVSLPPGTYTIIARSAWCGLLKIPVDIERGKTTSIHLDGNNWSPTPRPAADELVFLPNGEVAGWKGTSQ